MENFSKMYLSNLVSAYYNKGTTIFFAKFQVCLCKSLSAIRPKCAISNYLYHFHKRKGRLTSVSCTFGHHARGLHRICRYKVTIRRHQNVVGNIGQRPNALDFSLNLSPSKHLIVEKNLSMCLSLCFLTCKMVIINLVEHMWLLKGSSEISFKVACWKLGRAI